MQPSTSPRLGIEVQSLEENQGQLGDLAIPQLKTWGPSAAWWLQIGWRISLKKKVCDLEISELFSGSFIYNQDYSLCFLPATPYPIPSPSNSCPRLHLKPLPWHLAHSLSSLIPSPPLAPPQLVMVHPAVSLNFCCSDARRLHHTPSAHL